MRINFLFGGIKEAADLLKILFFESSNNVLLLVFHCLSIFELCDLKLVSRAFEELVNYSIKFKRIIDLSYDMCGKILLRNKIQENLLEFKRCVSAEFKDDPMLQLYVKNRLSSIFNKIRLCQIFSHFAYCKRFCDSEIECCRMYSRIYPHCLLDEFQARRN